MALLALQDKALHYKFIREGLLSIFRPYNGLALAPVSDIYRV